MTRVKKTRSLKRIHDVKTGSKSKLKKQLGADRQVGKRVQGRRVLSTYEKFLAANPEAKEAAKDAQLQAEHKALSSKAEDKNDAPRNETASKEKRERSKNLLDQFEDSNTKDIY